MNILNYTKWSKLNESINNFLPWHWDTLPKVKTRTKSIEEMKTDILNSIDRVSDFIQNNKLTGNILNAQWNEEDGISEMLHDLYENPNIEEYEEIFSEKGGSNFIKWKQKDPEEVGIPGSIYITNWYTDPGYALNVYWDTYKEVPIWTIYSDGDMFLFYTTHTPGNFNPSGSGFSHSYITDKDLIEGGMLYEAWWRIMLDPNDYNNIIDEVGNLSSLGVNMDPYSEYVYNHPYRITSDYFNPKFKELLNEKIGGK